MNFVMKKILFIAVTTLLLQGNSYAVVEDNVVVNFNNPEKFLDFKSDYMRSNKDQARLMTKLRKLMIESVKENIQNGYNFEITINDIDMAGRYIFNPERMIRIVKDSDRMKIEFSYKLSDKQGKILKNGDITLKEFGAKFSRVNTSKYKHSLFSNEMPAFDKWLIKQNF